MAPLPGTADWGGGAGKDKNLNLAREQKAWGLLRGRTSAQSRMRSPFPPNFSNREEKCLPRRAERGGGGARPKGWS